MNKTRAAILALLFGFVMMGSSVLGAQSAVAQNNDEPKKVYVCKYVGTPGVDERLQTGQNPIEVSVNSIQNNEWDGTIPGYFSDAHDRSYVLGYVPMSPEPTAASCPAGTPDDNNWTYEVTCTAVTGTRPNTDSVDSNIRIKNLDTNAVQTFNYHGPDNGPAGAFNYTLLGNYNVPASWTHYEIQWVQVNGTNYHWEGALECGGNNPPDDEYPYEVDACWTMETSDGIENTYQFPQTYGCDYEPKCEETVEFQYDTYWIRDAADEATLADIKANGLDSPAGDNSLEPHDYYSVVETNDELCETDEPTPTETVTITPPTETETVTLPPVTVTETVTPPAETVTVTASPSATVTETVVLPPVTTTETVTETPTTTVTETVTATATATATSTVTEHTTEHVTKHETDETVVYDWDTLPNTGLGKVFMGMFVCGLLLVALAALLAYRNRKNA